MMNKTPTLIFKEPQNNYNIVMIENGEIKVLISNITDISLYEIEKICILKNQHWTYSKREQINWWNNNSKSTDVVLRLLNNNGLIGFLRFRESIISLDNINLKVKVITEVSIDKKYQKKGIGKYLIGMAGEYIRNLVCPIGLLICDNKLNKFYLSCGWKKKTDIRIRESFSNESSFIDKNQNVFFYDPKNQIYGKVIITGKNF